MQYYYKTIAIGNATNIYIYIVIEYLLKLKPAFKGKSKYVECFRVSLIIYREEHVLSLAV